jgi:hypothetical protein
VQHWIPLRKQRRLPEAARVFHGAADNWHEGIFPLAKKRILQPANLAKPVAIVKAAAVLQIPCPIAKSAERPPDSSSRFHKGIGVFGGSFEAGHFDSNKTNVILKFALAGELPDVGEKTV